MISHIGRVHCPEWGCQVIDPNRHNKDNIILDESTIEYGVSGDCFEQV